MVQHKWYTQASGGTPFWSGGSAQSGGLFVSEYSSTFGSTVTYYVAAVCSDGTEDTRREPVTYTRTGTNASATHHGTLMAAVPGQFHFTASGGKSYAWRLGSPTSNVLSTSSSFYPTKSGTYYFNATHDCGGTYEKSWQINFIPTAYAGIDYTILPLSGEFFIYGDGSDPEGESITFSWTKQSGPSVTMTQTSTPVLRLVNVGLGTYVFRLTVTDSQGTSVYDEMTLNVISIANNNTYVREDIINIPGQLTNAQVDALGIGNKNVSYTYLNGLGSRLQEIFVQTSPTNKDILVPYEYDELARAKRSYLPMMKNQGNGMLVANPTGNGSYVGSDHYNFYSGTPGVPTDSKPYQESDFEPSPLGRVIHPGSFGEGFQPGQADTDIQYGANAANDIRLWTISGDLPSSSETWPQNLLSVVTTTNPVGVQSQQVSNRQGLKLVERVRLDASNWSETYYVYDIRNRLRFILPSELMAIIKPSGGSYRNPTQQEIDTWAYQYRYDEEGRTVESKGPGTDWVYNVYDKRDRIVLSQSGVQRENHEWSYTKYDELDRPVVSGIFRPGTQITRVQMQNTINELAGGKGFSNVNEKNIPADIVLTAYAGKDDYVATNSITLKPGFSFEAGVTSTAFRARIEGAGSDVYPTSNTEDLVVTYYDDYTSCPPCQEPEYQFVQEAWGMSSNEPFQKFDRVKGSAVASSVKVLNTESEQWLHSVSYYNRHGEIIQTLSTSPKGGVIRISNLVDFSGKLLKSFQWMDGMKITRRYTYDHMGRVTNVYHQINNELETIISSPEYNVLGEVIGKQVGRPNNYATTSYLQSVDYKKNVRGWMTHMNNTTASNHRDPGDVAPDYFAMEYDYANSFESGASPRPDGMFSAIKWRDDLSKKEKLYNFTYSNQGFMTGADYKMRDGNFPAYGWNFRNNKYSETVTYDRNGNIQTLERRNSEAFDIFFPYPVMDELKYAYEGNMLKNVTDEDSDEAGFKDGNINTVTGLDDYTYDKNGNLIKDRNKGIAQIEYNHLNLMEKVTFDDGSYIDYVYDASGMKLSTSYYEEDELLSKTEYIGDFVYIDGELEMIMHEEGRIVPPAYTNIIPNPTREANSLEGFTANGNVSLSAVQQNGETYVKVVCNDNSGTPGIMPIGGTITDMVEYASYTLKVLGYQTGSGSAKLYVWMNYGMTIQQWSQPLPVGEANETWATFNFTIPFDVYQVKIGVLWDDPATGDEMFINRVALYKTEHEYQYFIADHQGNTRVVLQTTPATLTFAATMEGENFDLENQQFLNLNPSFVETNPVANATLGGNEVIRMNSTYPVGPARSFKVFPGDRIDASVNAYYETATGLTHVATATIAEAAGAALSGGNMLIDGQIQGAYYGGPGLILSPFQGTTRPSAFLNYILFDVDFVPLKAESVPVGATPGVVHSLALPTISVEEVGTLFVYLSYDNEGTHPVYFDELKIIYQESPVIQVTGYYPYGLESYSWVREGEEENFYLYQGKEIDTKAGWYDFHARQYDAALGRWFAIDPANQFTNPYLAMGNNPVVYVDPDGEWIAQAIGAVVGGVSGYIAGRRAGLRGWELAGFTLASAGIGAVSGGIGAEVSAGVSAAFAAGANAITVGVVSGAAGGAAGGFVGGFYGTALSNSFGISDANPLIGGLKGAGYGTAIGGLFGGIEGGIKYGQQVKSARQSLMAAGVDPNAPVPATNADLNSFVQNNPILNALDAQGGNPTKQVASNTNLPAGNTLKGGLIADANGNLAGGLTQKIQSTYNSTTHGFRSNIWVAPARFSKAFKLFMTVGHELNHAIDYYGGNYYSWYEAFRLAGHTMDANLFAMHRSEVAAYTWSYNTAQQFRYQSYHYQNQISYYRGLLPFFPR